MPCDIQVDFDVYRELTYLRKSEDVTYSDVIRELLSKSRANRMLGGPSQAKPFQAPDLPQVTSGEGTKSLEGAAAAMEKQVTVVSTGDLLSRGRTLLRAQASTKTPAAETPASAEKDKPGPGGRSWFRKGVHFAHGTNFRAHYNGRTYTATVVDGWLVLDGDRFKSPSAAARSITGYPTNGWRFWEAQQADGSYKPIERLRGPR